MPNSIAQRQNYTNVLDEVYQNAACSTCLTSPRGMVRAGAHAHEILIPKISVTGLGNYTRNVGYTNGNITFAYETKAFNYDRGTRLLADVMDIEEAAVMDVFVAAGSELQRTQVAPEGDAFCFSQIAGHTGVTPVQEDFSSADAEDILASLRDATNEMDEKQVTEGTRILFITPTLKGILDDFSSANPNRSNAVLNRFSRIVKVPQCRFYTAITLNPGTGGSFGYSKHATNGKDINYMIVGWGRSPRRVRGARRLGAAPMACGHPRRGARAAQGDALRAREGARVRSIIYNGHNFSACTSCEVVEAPQVLSATSRRVPGRAGALLVADRIEPRVLHVLLFLDPGYLAGTRPGRRCPCGRGHPLCPRGRDPERHGDGASAPTLLRRVMRFVRVLSTSVT